VISGPPWSEGHISFHRACDTDSQPSRIWHLAYGNAPTFARPPGGSAATSPSPTVGAGLAGPGLIAPNWEKQLWTVTIRRPSPPDIADVAKLDPRSHHAVALSRDSDASHYPARDVPSARRGDR
jgi:hypothetical protein